jgi:hypothetical protein
LSLLVPFTLVLVALGDTRIVLIQSTIGLFAWLISHQSTVLFSHIKPATSNQPAVLFSQNKPASATSHQPTDRTG